MKTDLRQDRLFGIYVHWPYCTKICPYCDFNVYAAKQRDPDPLVSALRADLSRQAAALTDREVTSLYFGGGSPSLIPPALIDVLRMDVRAHWENADDIEVTLEVNPEDVDYGRLRDWKAAGVNRISLGVQALDDQALKFLGRAHDRYQALKAIELTLSVFDNVSVDMIYARPGQSIEAWLNELADALKTGAPHLSLYELTIKEKTAFEKQVERFVFTPLDDEEQADLYLETLKATANAGLRAYEVSNHAKAPEYWSRHNLTYWLGGEWMGLGPGAEGRLTLDGRRVMTRGMDRPSEYQNDLFNGGSGLGEREVLTKFEEADERLIMGLRSVLGVDRAKLEQLYGESLDQDVLNSFKESGHLREEDGRLILTEAGWLLADFIARELSP